MHLDSSHAVLDAKFWLALGRTSEHLSGSRARALKLSVGLIVPLEAWEYSLAYLKGIIRADMRRPTLTPGPFSGDLNQYPDIFEEMVNFQMNVVVLFLLAIELIPLFYFGLELSILRFQPLVFFL
ncbi:uncharacterized protein PpBr36_09896 [Pyricularia pennisetigena]|uniref:uncharacterized protein n=1 Tax=Pyricularia pennisetigena TaxID=1578925 RepID=UPI0011538566|nr:uncharacterized protein PpBr36_09896 [Pyricularia pennisetigena]TLS22541.1 hypothetical protein PpBr36_09896 [Pyricularia pennisetigena]